MPKLGHIATKLDGLKKKAATFIDVLYKQAQKAALYNGYSRVYEPYSQSGDRAETAPPENQLVQMRAQEVIGQVRAALTEVIDLTHQQDTGNCEAKADVVLDGTVLLKDMPVTTIMFLLKKTEELLAFVGCIPTPDQAVDWVWDPNLGLLKSKAPAITQRTAKVPKVLIKYEATEKHPAQTEVFHVDSPIGEYKKLEFSGALARNVKDEILVNLTKLMAALKEARETANMSVQVKEVKIADTIMSFVFQPLVPKSANP